MVLLCGTVGAAPPKPAGRRGKQRAPATEAPAPSPEGPKAPPTPLDGTRWQLRSYRGSDGESRPPLEGSVPTARFRAGRIITGATGCNTFTAGYTYDAGDMTVSQPAASRMACPQPQMEQDAAYLAALHRVAHFTLSDDTLTLTDVRGVALLTYQREPPPVLAGTTWRMTGYNDAKGGFAPALGNVTVSATFGSDGRLTGSAGCNEYRGKFTQTGDTLAIGPLILMTRKACAPETLAQERAYLIALRSATRAELNGDQLLLARSGDTRAVGYAASSPPPP